MSNTKTVTEKTNRAKYLVPLLNVSHENTEQQHTQHNKRHYNPSQGSIIVH